MAVTKTLQIMQGKTFIQVVRWAQDRNVFKPITAVALLAPVAITAVGHGIPDGWPVNIQSVKGATQLNSVADEPATIVGADTFELNAIDASLYSAYKSGGYVRYKQPYDLAGCTARMSVKDKVGGTQLLSLTTLNSRIVLDNTAKTITLTLTAADTAALTWKTGVYDLELVAADTTVSLLLSGKVTVSPEITT
jgi:hypothetical protein